MSDYLKKKNYRKVCGNCKHRFSHCLNSESNRYMKTVGEFDDACKYQKMIDPNASKGLWYEGR